MMKRYEIIAVLCISLFWIILLLFYTHGGLLVGGDWAGYYEPTRLLHWPIAPQEVIYDIALIVTGGNIYGGFYLGLFLSTFLTLLSFFYFVKSLFKGIINRKFLLVLASVSTLLYLFSLPTLTDTFKSLVNVVLLANAGFYVFLAELCNLIKNVRLRLSEKFDYKNMILMGVGIGLSSGFPPNAFRILLLEIIIFVLAVLLTMVSLKSLTIIKQVFRKVVPAVLISVIIMLYWLAPFISNFEQNIEVLTSAYSTRSYGQPSRLTPSYATLPQVLRVIGSWQFQTIFVPYHELYFTNFVITIASFMWPILVLGLPLLLCNNREKHLLLPMTLIVLVVIFWEKAGNPPLGEIYIFLVSNAPQIQGMFPTDFLQMRILAPLYPIMATFSVIKLYEVVHSKVNYASSTKNKTISLLLPVFLTILLLISVWPIWSGMAVSQYYDPSIKGIWIPNEYTATRYLLKNATRYNEAVLFYPAISTYVQTSWGYQGTNGFYNNFFSPLLIITPDYFGGYSQYNPKLWRNYLSLVSPKLLPRERIKLDTLNYEKIGVYHTRYQLQSNYTQVYLYDFSYDENSWVDISLPFKEPMNFSDYALLTLKVNANSTEYLNQAIDNGGLWIGMTSGQYTGWYIIGSSINSNSIIEQNDTMEIMLTLNSPDKPWSTSIYYVDNVNGLFIKLKKDSVSSNNLTLVFPTLYVSQEVAISEDYVSLIKQYNIGYIIYDASISSGALSAYQSYEIVIDALIKSGFLTIVYNGQFLRLYEIQINK